MTAAYTSASLTRNSADKGGAMSTWPNVYLKVMRATKKHFPEVNLKILTREDVLELNLPCKTIADAVRAGYLEQVPGFENLDQFLSQIQTAKIRAHYGLSS